MFSRVGVRGHYLILPLVHCPTSTRKSIPFFVPMKFTLTINQKIIVEQKHDIDIIDAAILETIFNMEGSRGILKLVHNNVDFYWMAHKKLCDELPILRMKKDSMYRRIKKLIEKNYIQPHPQNKELRATYYRTTELTESLFSDIGNKSDISDKNPNGIGNSSDRVSDENPKDNNTKDNNTKDNRAKTKFVAPTLEEVLNYCQEKGVHSDFAQNFIDYNENRDWKLNNRQKMKSWKLTFNTAIRQDWNKKYLKSNTPPTKNLVQAYQAHLQKYLNDKQRKSMNGKIQAYLSKAGEKAVQAEIRTFKANFAPTINPTFTEALIFDFCYGSISQLSGSGTTPEKAMSKFRQFYQNLSEYKQNKNDLRTDYKNYLIRKHG